MGKKRAKKGEKGREVQFTKHAMRKNFIASDCSSWIVGKRARNREGRTESHSWETEFKEENLQFTCRSRGKTQKRVSLEKSQRTMGVQGFLDNLRKPGYKGNKGGIQDRPRAKNRAKENRESAQRNRGGSQLVIESFGNQI